MMGQERSMIVLLRPRASHTFRQNNHVETPSYGPPCLPLSCRTSNYILIERISNIARLSLGLIRLRFDSVTIL